MADLIDFAFPFQLDEYGRVKSKEGSDAITDLLEQIILTSMGERVYRPNFGSQILRFIFEPIDIPIGVRTAEIASEIQSAIERSEGSDGPIRMALTNLEISTENETTTVFVEIVDSRGEISQISMEL